MSILISVGKYIALIAAICIAGWVFTKMAMTFLILALSLLFNFASLDETIKFAIKFPLWVLVSLIIATLLAEFSLRFIGVSDPFGLSHYRATSDGNAINVRSVTNSEHSSDVRRGLILFFIAAVELYFWINSVLEG